MNRNELKAERIRQGKDTKYMAKVAGIKYGLYLKREHGDLLFKPKEIALIAEDLNIEHKMLHVYFSKEEVANFFLLCKLLNCKKNQKD